MRKFLSIFLTTLLIFLTSSSVFASCTDYSHFQFSITGADLVYINGSGQSSVSSTFNNNPVYLSNFNSINQIRVFLDTDYDFSFFDYDNVYLSGSFTFYAPVYIDSNGIAYSTLPNSLPAPSFGGSSEAFCEYLSISLDNSIPSYFSTNSNNNQYVFNTFSYVLKCPIIPDNIDDADNLHLVWFLAYPNTSTNFSSFSDLGFIFHFNSNSTISDDICSTDEISAINNISGAVVDVSDKLDSLSDSILDSDVSSAVLGAESFFTQSDDMLQTFGLADFVSAGINFIKAIRFDYACTPLQLPSILGVQLTLPCFTDWLYNFNPTFYNLYHIVLTFYIGYLICSDLIYFIKNLRDPQNDNITILDI